MKYLVGAVFAVFAAIAALPAQAANPYQVVYSFCPNSGCADGADPWAPPVGDGAGNYFGTTAGGDSNGGTIYELSSKHNKWTYKLLYTFCTVKKCPDGEAPHGQLVRDTKGNLYGTTQFGGAKHEGVVFELSPKGGSWTYTEIHDFCSLTQCTDGGNPTFVTLSYQGQASGVPYDGTSPLFGATTGDGSKAPATVFSLTLAKKKWTYTVLYTFCSQANCTDGAKPYSAPIVDGSGNLFGTTTNGGANAGGTVYELMPQGKKYVQSVLYSFCAQAICADGGGPSGPPLMDGNGNLFGTTSQGGAGTVESQQGTAYELTPNGASWTYTKLYDFCSQTNCADGSNPFGGLTLGPGGSTLLGAAFFGGDLNLGTIFQLGGPKLTKFTRLASMGNISQLGGAPFSPPVANSATTFIGTTASGGDGNEGVIYQLKP